MMDRVPAARGSARAVDFSVAPPPGWQAWRRDELARNTRNGRVGSVLVSESVRTRVWHLVLQPGERAEFHRHVLDYFWTVTQPGHTRSHYGAGEVADTTYTLGDTRHFSFAAGQSMIHDLENIGDEPVGFVTVEFLDSANPPLAV